MRALDALIWAQGHLRQAGLDDAALEAELLLRHALGIGRARLFASLRQPLAPDRLATFIALLERRLGREPTAYILGHKEFYDLELAVTPAALIPRPETELVVEEALRLARARPSGPLRLVDVGTGCGAIALALAKHLPTAQVVASDLSTEALALARANAQRLGLAHRLHWVLADLLTSLEGPFDLIVGNLPYVKSSQWATLAPEIRLYEPRGALDGGRDGLCYIRRLLAQAPERLALGGALILEIGWDQGTAVGQLVKGQLPSARIGIRQDLAGLDRVVVVERPATLAPARRDPAAA